MAYTKKQIEELAKIMSIKKEAVLLLKYIRPKGQIINGFGCHLTKVFTKLKLSGLCEFRVGDIAKVARKENICDVLLWVAPPHTFGKAKTTIKILRRLIKNNGLIVIGDAYLLSGIKSAGLLKNYENLTKTHQGYISFGDDTVVFVKIVKAHFGKMMIFTPEK